MGKKRPTSPRKSPVESESRWESSTQTIQANSRNKLKDSQCPPKDQQENFKLAVSHHRLDRSSHNEPHVADLFICGPSQVQPRPSMGVVLKFAVCYFPEIRLFGTNSRRGLVFKAAGAAARFHREQFSAKNTSIPPPSVAVH